MEEINLDSHFNSPDTPSVNFGGGIELLMNDRKKNSTPTDHISLEDELKELDSFSFKPSETKPMQFKGFTVEKSDVPISIGKSTMSFDAAHSK